MKKKLTVQVSVLTTVNEEICKVIEGHEMEGVLTMRVDWGKGGAGHLNCVEKKC